MSDLSNSINYPATSAQQVRQQLQATADHYHLAIQQHNTLADLVRTAFNEADYAATTSQQAPSVPTHVHTVMQGGSPTATPSGVVSSVLHGIVAGLEDAGDDAIHMAHNVIQHVLAYDHAMNDPVHLARYVEQSALLGSAALNQAAGTATSIANAIEHPSVLMTAAEHSITGFMHEPLARQVEEVTHWGVSFFGPAAALKGATVLDRAAEVGMLSRSGGFFAGGQEALFKAKGLSAEEANIPFIEAGDRSPYAAGTRARIIQLQNDRVFVRVHGELNQARAWMMRPEEVEGLTPRQIKDKFALPELPKYISEVHMPSGSYLQLGTTASQVKWGSGGSTQYQALDWVDEELFQNRRLLAPEANYSRGMQP